MKSTNCLILFILALTLTISSCKKDEQTLSKKEMLTAKSWKTISKSINGVLDELEDCNKDDILTLLTNGNYTIDPNTNKCSPLDKIESGTWTLTGDEKILTINGEDIMTIDELTKSKLVISQIVGSNTVVLTLIPI